jgi:uncharacterized protein (DUF433 family)
MLTIGVYTAERTAALSGVPKSTIHYWARHGVLTPSVSAEKVKLWSYADLMALRVIDWLRSQKATKEGHLIPRSKMRAVRAALAALRREDLPIWDGGSSALVVNAEGKVYIEAREGLTSVAGEFAHRDLLLPIAPFTLHERSAGPDLMHPRPTLRIIPGKLGGSPHVVDTRIETRALSSLHDSGMSIERIAALYPNLQRTEIEEAVDLEEQLKRNLLAA